jgi:uncharacterized protein (DUF486 family)
MTKYYDYIIFIILISLSSIVYQVSNFYNKRPDIGNNFPKILFISLCFAMIEYCLKIPAMYYYGKNINSIVTYSFILVTIFIFLVINSKFILKEKIHYVTYIAIFLIIIILIIHGIIINKIKVANS